MSTNNNISSGAGTNPSDQPKAPTKQSSSDAQNPQQHTIGHYVLGKALGEGTFGKVKLGSHILTGEKVAVKVLEKSRIKDKKDVERISREIKILKQLHHPNVVQIYEIIETEKDLYLVMEFVQGGELFDLIVKNQRLKEKTACKYFQELISGIEYIHQLGICHRDLKPENLLIDYDESLKIVDFGLSNLYEQGNTLKTACGSPCYAAPEMIAGQRYNGLMSDLWSCGVVLFAMLCGYLPYEDQKTSDLYKKILNAEYNLPDFLSDDARDIIGKIFITDPNKRINIEQIRQHPWYQIYKSDSQSYLVCPPGIQAKRPDFITQNGKQFKIVQRPNLLNQKIIQNLEAKLQFNRESLLKSIKNNKHNHLTATYYLLLKKHMIRQMKPYTEAFLELKPYDNPDSASEINLNNHRNNSQKPVVQLKSKQVQEAIKNKDQQLELAQDKAEAYGYNQYGQPQNIGQKKFQSIDHNQIIGNDAKVSNEMRHQYDKAAKKQNLTENDTRPDQNSRISNKRKSSENREDVPINDLDQNGHEFYQEKSQKFVKKEKTNQKHAQNAFNHRREQSANPYISAGTAAVPPQNNYNVNSNNSNFDEYQKNVDQYKMEQSQNSKRNSRWKQNQNNYNGLGDNSNNNTTSTINDLSSRRNSNNNTQKHHSKQQKSQDSFKNVLNNENHPSVNAQLINDYQVKKRAESYNKKRRSEKDSNGSLDKLDQFGIIIDDDKDDEQPEYIQSKNMKYSQKGNQREVRASSSGSSGSQPRVQVAGGTKSTGSTGTHNSVNSSGVQRRYDSIEHQRQSQIDKFLQSPQEQIATLMNQKKQNPNFNTSDKYSKKIMTTSGKDQIRKSQVVGYTGQPAQNQQAQSSNKVKPDNINIVNILKNKGQQQSSQSGNGNIQVNQKKNRNSSKPIALTEELTGEDTKNNFNQNGAQTKSSNQMNSQNSANSNTQASSQYYKQLQQQLANLNQKRQQVPNGSNPNYSQQTQQYQNNLKNMMSDQSNQMILQNIQNIQQNLVNSSYNESNAEISNISNMDQRGDTNKTQQQSASNSNYITQQNSSKQVHRKAKSMLNQNGVQNEYQNQKVQQIKLSDGNFRHLVQQFTSNNPNGNVQKINPNQVQASQTMVPGTAPTMPNAPKSGNVLKLKQPVTRNKSSQNKADRPEYRGDRGTRGEREPRQNSQTLNANQNSNIFIQQQLQGGKKKILHTTKNTSGQSHQQNFDIIEAQKQGSSNHQQSVQTTNQRSRKPSNVALNGQSGVTLSSNYSKGHNKVPTQPTPDNQNLNNKEGYLQNMMREYNQNQQAHVNPGIKNTNASNNSIPSQVQILSQQFDCRSNDQQSSNKRSNVKIQKIQKNNSIIKSNQVENIQKQISQNQKAMQNMTQNLFQKNNGGSLIANQHRQSHQMDYDDSLKIGAQNNFNDSLRGSSQGLQTVQKNSQNGNINQTSQNQAQRRYSHHQGQNLHIKGQASYGGGQPSNVIQTQNIRQSSQPKTNAQNSQVRSGNSRGNQSSNAMSHFQTHDNRQPKQNRVPATSQNDSELSETASNNIKTAKQQMRMKPNTVQVGQDPRNYPTSYLDNIAANSAMSEAITAMNGMDGNLGLGGGMDEVLGQLQAQMDMVSNNAPKQKQQQINVQQKAKSNGTRHPQERSDREYYKQTNQQSDVKDYGGSYLQSQQSIGSQKQSISGHGGQTQMSIMSKYNQQQIQIQQNQKREQRNPNYNGQGQTRHYSAPREGSYGNVMDEDEIKRQHLLNQSVDMSQINNLQAQIKNLNGGFKQYDDINKTGIQGGQQPNNVGNYARGTNNNVNTQGQGQNNNSKNNNFKLLFIQYENQDNQ